MLHTIVVSDPGTPSYHEVAYAILNLADTLYGVIMDSLINIMGNSTIKQHSQII